MRRVTMRLKFETVFFSSSAFETMICSPLEARRRVVFRPTFSTVPEVSRGRDEVADLEGLVDRDRERGEHVAEHVLHRQRDGDAADPEAGDKGGDVDAEVGQQGQREDHPDARLQHPDDQGVRHRDLGVSYRARGRGSSGAP
jgi:hypothetical protein